MNTQTDTASDAAAAERSRASEGPAKPWFRVFAFHGGGLDTVMQLGIAHALLLAEGRIKGPRRCDMIAGISAGAINAVALAEILQAGRNFDGEERLAAQVARFLEFLEAYRNAPATVLRGFLPDPYETNFRKALKPITLPRHFGAERKLREESISTRTGLIKLLNGLLNIRVRVRSIARYLRLVLGWSASKEIPVGRRWKARAWILGKGWWLLFENLPVLSVLVGRVAGNVVFAPSASREKGVEAARIMFDSRVLRSLKVLLEWVAGAVLLAGVLGVLGLLAVFFVVMAAFSSGARNYLLFAVAVLVIAVDSRHPQAVAWGLGGCGLLWLARCLRGLRRARPANPATGIWKRIRKRLLEHYRIYSDFGDSYALQEALVRLFDPEYFGKFRLDIGIDRALKHKRAEATEHDGPPPRRCLHSYGSHPSRPLKVTPLAANVRSGRIEALPDDASVVDALMGACAVIPFYKAQPIPPLPLQAGTRWFIDGVNVANDPVTEALAALRADPAQVEKISAQNCGVRIYSVPLLPIEADGLRGKVETYTGLVQVGLRALQLQKFQDALLEKRLVETYRAALPPKAVFKVRQPGGEDAAFFLTELVHLTPALPLQLNSRIPCAQDADERRALMDAAVAEGCRAFLERMLSADEHAADDADEETRLRKVARRLPESVRQVDTAGRNYVPCRLLFAGEPSLPGRVPGAGGRLPAADEGPGIPEVCRRCSVACGREPDARRLERHIRLPLDLPATPTEPAAATLAGATWQPPAPATPHPEPILPAADPLPETTDAAVAFVFSGGVFRGVFQVGFANAVSELNLMPDVIVGASVGTIMGALIGRVLQPPELENRRFQAQRLAATFLAVDQFVMTDRCADFVRRFSIRAVGADFSPRDADRTFRRYDEDGAATFGPRLRRVVAGLERLFYVSPFELRDFVETARLKNYKSLWIQFKTSVQEWFDRYGVGLELLGPEPLQMLIDGILFDDNPPEQARFDQFARCERGFQLLGTATNLTEGRLDLLGSTEKYNARLTQGLLASSAFPAVFRPRWSWELFENPPSVAQYCDGGVMDNLPLDSVVEYLADRRGDKGPRFPRRPAVPHLILAASLEPEPEDWRGLSAEDLGERCLSWIELRRRASELAYNGKIDKFADAQTHIRRIIQQRGLAGFPDREKDHLPLDLEVAVVKAKWLCSTFAFHDMLGFRREDQAASIAHGCAATFQRLSELFYPVQQAGEAPGVFHERKEAAETRRSWAAKKEKTKRIAFEQLAGGTGRRDLTPAQQDAGVCWYRSLSGENGEPLCPFAAPVVRQRAADPAGLGDGARRETLAVQLDAIYRACGQPKTHQRR